MTGLYGMRFGPTFGLALGNHFCTISLSEAVVLSTSDLGQGILDHATKYAQQCLWVWLSFAKPC